MAEAGGGLGLIGLRTFACRPLGDRRGVPVRHSRALNLEPNVNGAGGEGGSCREKLQPNSVRKASKLLRGILTNLVRVRVDGQNAACCDVVAVWARMWGYTHTFRSATTSFCFVVLEPENPV